MDTFRDEHEQEIQDSLRFFSWAAGLLPILSFFLIGLWKWGSLPAAFAGPTLEWGIACFVGSLFFEGWALLLRLRADEKGFSILRHNGIGAAFGVAGIVFGTLFHIL